MKPKMYDVEILKDIAVGEAVEITGEMRPASDVNASFRGFLMGEVKYKDETYFISINKTSYKTIAVVLGDDTKDWVGKEIVYKGKVKMGAMEGNLWEAR